MSFWDNVINRCGTVDVDLNAVQTEKRWTVLYIVSFICYLSVTMIDEKTLLRQCFPSLVFTAIRYICILLIVVKIIFARDYRYYSKRGVRCLVLLTGLLLLVSHFNDSRTLLHYEIIVVGAYRIPFREIAKWIIVSQSVLIALIVVLALTGTSPTMVNYRASTDSIRYSLGFTFPTYPAILAYYLSGLFVYTRSNQLRIIEYVAIFLINIFFYLLTATRTEIILVVLILVCGGLLRSKFNNVLRFILRWGTIVLPPVLLALSLVLAYTYTPSNACLKTLNNLLSDRLALANDAVDEYGFELLGQHIEWKNWEDLAEGESRDNFNIVDNGYINILLNYGPIVLIVLLYGFNLLCRRIDDPYLHIVLCAMFIHMMLTPQLLQLVYDAYLLCLAPVLLNAGKQDSSGRSYLLQKEGQ